MIGALQNTSHQLLGIRKAGWAERGDLSQGNERLCLPHLGTEREVPLAAERPNTTACARAHGQKEDYFTKKR